MGDHFEIEKTPSWVVNVGLTDTTVTSRFDISSGAYASLIDVQLHVPLMEMYSHYAIDVVTAGGISSASEISIAYDTSYQEVQFHGLYVWRDGVRIDRTSNLSFEFLRNEQHLASKLYTGMITAYEVLEDIRKGDRIEYSYTVVGDNPIFNGRVYQLLPLESANPIDRLFIRVLRTPISDFRSFCNSCDSLGLREIEENGLIVIELDKLNIPAADYEESIPPWHMPYPYLSVSGFKDWRQVHTWAEEVFKVDQQPDVAALAKTLSQKHQTKEDQIKAAISHVQNNIRYMGMEDGIGSIKPFPPDRVLKQGFGDCKDKSLLLTSLLQELGIEQAYPALVNTYIGKGVALMLPGAQAFNHCIVHFYHGGREYWIDPTFMQQQGSLDRIGIVDYHRALVVGQPEYELKSMDVVDSVSRIVINEEFLFPSVEESATLNVMTTYHGLKADQMRASLEFTSTKEMSDVYKQSYGRLFQNIKVAKPLEIHDDVINNTVTTIETYGISGVWNEVNETSFSGWQFRYEPLELYPYVLATECEEKKYPVLVNHPVNFEQTTTLHFPKRVYIRRQNAQIKNAAFEYERDAWNENDTTTVLSFRFKSLNEEISPEEFGKSCPERNKIQQSIVHTFRVAKTDFKRDVFKQQFKSIKPLPQRIESYPIPR